MTEEENNILPVIENINIEDEMRVSYIDYSMSVIIGRALPDVRDGLKPVHRRVLFAMKDLSNYHNKAYKKSARIVGDVIGKYHPHGDTAVYETAVRMAQEFSMRYQLIDGQGNFGSIDGDSAAAMRYTEIRMQKMAEDLLEDLDKDTVEFGPNYDESLVQPLVLPAKLPNLFLNGSTGIAVGMATNVPPHNLNELADAITYQIDNPNCQVEDLMQFVKGPDFPTGGIICGTKPIYDTYKHGRGHIRVRGRTTTEELSTGRERIIITEVPYTVNKAKMIEAIAHLVHDKIIEGISDIRDESNKDGIRVVIELKRKAMAEVVLNQLYKHTQLQTTFAANVLAIDNGRPKRLNLKQYIKCYTDHRFEVITRRTKFDLRKAEERAHILDGFKVALDNMDELVRLIRASKNRDEAKERIVERFGFSDVQAKTILEMRLYQLTGMEREKVEDEYNELMIKVNYYKDLLANSFKIYNIIKEDLVEMKAKYGDERRTSIEPWDGDIDFEDLIEDKPCIITITNNGYISRVPINTFKEQRRGGKGVLGMSTNEDDNVEQLFVANTHDTMMFFTQTGRGYWLKVYRIPEASRTSKGRAIINLLNLQEDETITKTISVKEFDDDHFMVMATERGVVKKSRLSRYKNVRQKGVNSINLDEGDTLIGIAITDGSKDIMLATRNGKSIRFHEDQAREVGRVSRGVRGIRLASDDIVKSMVIVDDESNVLFCCENGFGKRSKFSDYRAQGRGGQGLIAIKTSERNGKVVSAHVVKENDALMLLTIKGKMVRTGVESISLVGRYAQGVTLINLNEGDKLAATSTFTPEPEIEETPEDGEATAEGTENVEGAVVDTAEATTENPDAVTSTEETTDVEPDVEPKTE
jgi:DNA gyrase subunit A